jgi:ribosomal-protein-alanine N-acetyltransferase
MTETLIEIDGIRLQKTTLVHETGFLAAVGRSRDLHHPWVHPASTPAQFATHLARFDSESHLSLLAVTESDELAGCINLNEIVRGAFQSAYLGYYAFNPLAASGRMFTAMRAVLTYAFTTVGLHRLEANIQPGNLRSIGLVEALGFRHEGFSPRYLRIGQEWKDHERFAITLEDAHRSDLFELTG